MTAKQIPLPTQRDLWLFGYILYRLPAVFFLAVVVNNGAGQSRTRSQHKRDPKWDITVISGFRRSGIASLVAARLIGIRWCSRCRDLHRKRRRRYKPYYEHTEKSAGIQYDILNKAVKSSHRWFILMSPNIPAVSARRPACLWPFFVWRGSHRLRSGLFRPWP